MKTIKLIFLISILIFANNRCTTIYHQVKDKLISSYKDGIILYNKKNYKDALDKFETVASIEPKYKRVNYYLRITKSRLNKKEKKLQIKADYYYKKAVSYKNRKKYESALLNFLESDEISPGYKNVDSEISFCREKLNNVYDKKIKTANRLAKRKLYKKAYLNVLAAKRIKPEGLDVFLLSNEIEDLLDEQSEPFRLKAEKHYANKNFKAAKENVFFALKVNPWDEEAKSLLEKCNSKLLLEDNYNNAVTSYKKRNYITSYNQFQKIKTTEPNYKNADTYMEKIISNLKNSKQYSFNKGLRYYEKGYFRKAISEWNKVLFVDPGNNEVIAYKKRAEAKLKIKNALKDR